jgi:uncharacterized membrane protein YeaQ/YmgE (transglycosylase-associated protein family)
LIDLPSSELRNIEPNGGSSSKCILFSSLHRGSAVGTFIFAMGAVQAHPNWAISTAIAIVGAVVIWIIGRAARYGLSGR